ncbi:MAG: FGGY-family carbohydrate kinase [Candidatus Thorarchaeota archaeon]
MAIAAIDAGTTGVRCMIFDKTGKVLGVSRKTWGYSTPSDLEIAKEFDPSEFWKHVCSVVMGVTMDSRISPSDIEAVATTSQRHGIILLDEDGNELHGGPNIDARGAMTQYIIEESLGDKYHEITGCWPPLMFSPTRIGWFEEEEPEIFESVAHLLPICDWITFKLTGEYTTDLSSAGGTGFLDIRKGKWSKEVASAIGIDLKILPEIHESGEEVGTVMDKAAQECGLPSGLSVVQGGADTHCALLASDSRVGEITTIAGSTTPVMMPIAEFVCSADQKIWTGSHMVKGKWVIESNAMMTGANLEWAVNLLCERSNNPEECVRRTFEKLDEIVKNVQPGSNDTYVAIGPRVMDVQQMTNVKQAKMIFPQPALPQVVPLDSSHFLHAVIENIAYAVRGNIEQLDAFKMSTRLKTIGGLSLSETWPQMLANVLNRPVRTPVQSEGSLLGAAICAAVGAGHYSSIEEASKTMVKWRKIYEPDDRAKTYQSYYTRWCEIWDKGE